LPNSFTVSPDALGYAAARFARPDWARGTISHADAAFLADMVLRTRPRAIAEIGVASGASTAFLSTLLSDRLPDSEIFAFDALAHVYNEPAKPVGAFVRQLFGRTPANLSLKPGMASYDIRNWADRPERFDFVFLDANHEHPWPCLDILSIVDILKPGSWIVLHDIGLPLISREARAFGPLYLHQNWPGEKCAPTGRADGEDANIGAIRLFDDPARSVRALTACASLPWQARPPAESLRAALSAAAEIDGDFDGALRALLERPPHAHRVPLRRCEITLRGPNPWSRMATDLVSEPLVLHANLPGEPVASVVVSGLDTRSCHGLIAPCIARAPEAPVPIKVRLSLRSRDGFEGPAIELVLKDSESRSACLIAPDRFGDSFNIEISVALAEKTEKLHGAWVKFRMLHLV
jgi:predicted O-methyltransferase YrrM